MRVHTGGLRKSHIYAGVGGGFLKSKENSKSMAIHTPIFFFLATHHFDITWDLYKI